LHPALHSAALPGILHLITVVHFRDPWDAHIFRGRLEADGVPAFVTDDIVIGMRWYLSLAFGGVRVQVPNAYAARAAQILEDAESGTFEAELVEVFGDIDLRRCPKCSSANVRRRPSLVEFLIGIGLTFMNAGKVVANRCTCRVCGTRWTDTRYDQ
jgi:hypothetical protein